MAVSVLSSGLLRLPAEHVNVVLNTEAGSGSKLVLVDDGGANGRKYVCKDAKLFAQLLARYASVIKMVKLKGCIADTDLEPILAGMALLKDSLICDFGCKSATFSTAETADRLAQLLFESLPSACCMVVAKKVERTRSSFATAADVSTVLRGLVKVEPAAQVVPATAQAIKLKAKLGKSVSMLQDFALASSVAAYTEESDINAAAQELFGCRPGPLTSIKLRGPLTSNAAASIATVLQASTHIDTVKFMRFWLAPGEDASAIAKSLVDAAVACLGSDRRASAPSSPASVNFTLKRKGVGEVSITIAGSSGDGMVKELSEAFVAYSAPPG